MAKRTLNVVIAGDTKGLNKAFAATETNAKRMEKRIGTASSSIGRSLGTAAKVGTAAIGIGLVGAIKGSIDAFAEAQRVAAQTNAVLKSTGGAANVTAKEVSNLATALSRKSGMDDEAIQSGQNLLLTFTKLRNEQGKGNDIFSQATTIMADMSTALGQDTKASAIQLGKALNNPIKGVTALQRVGVAFTDSQKEQIKTLVESGRTMDAQKLILKELRTEFGGSAEAAGNTFAGKINKAKVAVGNLGEAIGGTLAPALGAAADKLSGFVEDLATSDRPAQFFRGIGDFAKDAANAIGSVGDKFKALKATRGGTGAAIGVMIADAFEDVNWTKIAQTMGDGISKAFTAGGTFARGVQAGIGAAMENVDGRKLLSGLLRVVSEAINALFSPSFWKENFANIFATVTLVIPIAKILKIPGAQWLFNWISKPFFSAMGKFGSWLAGLFGRISSRAFGTFLAEIEKFAPRLANAMLKLATGGVGAIRGFPGRVAAVASRAVNAIADRIGDGIGKVAGAMAKLVAGALRPFASLGGKLAARLGSALADGTKKIASWAGNFTRAALDIGKKIVDGIVRGIKSTAGKIGSAITGGIGAVGSFLSGKGEGIGKEIGQAFGSMPRGGAISGSLDGADAGMRPFATIGQRFGLRVSDGLRPGGITSSGNPSWHATGEALDLAGPPAGMMQTFKFLKSRLGGRLAELIYTPGGAGIKNGAPYTYTGKVAADHFDHVHVAMDLGKPGQGDGTGRVGRRARTGDGPGRSVQEQVFRFFKSKGFTDGQAAAWIGVLMQESGLSTSAVNPKSGATGIAQWLGGRLTALKSRSNWRTLGGQLNFLWSELQGSERGAYSAIKAAKGVGDATSAITWKFERPGRSEANMPNRLRVASAAYKAFAGKGGGGATSGGGGGGNGPSRESLENKIERNLDKLDTLASRLRNMPSGKKYTARRKTIQNQQAKLRSENRHIREQIRDLPKDKTEEKVSAFDAAIAPADLAIAVATARAGEEPERGSVAATRLSWAMRDKRMIIGKRIRRIRRELKKKGLRPAKKLRLQTELATLIGDHASLGQQARDLVTPEEVEREEPEAPDLPSTMDFLNRDLAAAGLTPGKEDDVAAATAIRDQAANELAYARAVTNDPRIHTQFIDAFKSAEDALKSLTDTTQEQTDAMKAHTDAMNAVKDELKRQTDVATAIQTTENFQLKKYLADVFSGEIGGRGVGRAFTPGSGKEFAW